MVSDLFQVGDIVEFIPERRPPHRADDDRKHVVTRTVSVPAASLKGVGHSQWLELNGRGFVSGYYLRKVTP
jgi:hypothetical protein